MVKLSHSKMILISGFLWFGAGTMLLWKGISFLNECIMNFNSSSHPLIQRLNPYFGGISESVIVIMCIALTVGFLKGRFVLGKSAARSIRHIKTLSNPDSIGKMFSTAYLMLYFVMVGFGVFLNVSGCPIDIRGAIDVTVGSALLHGSIIYLREWVAQPSPA